MAVVRTRLPEITQDYPAAGIAIARAAAWCVALGVGLWGGHLSLGKLGWLAAAPLAVQATQLPALVRRRVPSRATQAVNIALELIVAGVLAYAAGAGASLFAALFFLIQAEAAAIFGASGSSAVATIGAALCAVWLVPRTTPATISAWVMQAGLLALVAAIRRMWPTPQPEPEPSTALADDQIVEQLKDQAQELQEQNTRLRTSNLDTTVALREQLARLADLTTAQEILTAAMTDDSDAVAGRLLRPLQQTLEAGSAAVWLRSDDGKRLTVWATAGQVAPIVRDREIAIAPDSQPSQLRAACEEQLRGSTPTAAARRSFRPGESVEIDPATDDSQEVVGAALRLGDELIGVVALGASTVGRFPKPTGERLRGMAPTLAAAVENVRQRSRLTRNVRELTLMQELGNLAGAAESLDELYIAVLEMASRLVSFENGTVYIFDAVERQLQARATRGRAVNLIDHIVFDTGTGVSGWVAQRKKLLFVEDIAREHGLLSAELIPPRVRSFISVPMFVRGEVVGVINISHSQPHAFTQDDLRILSVLANQAALTINRAEILRSVEQMAVLDTLTGTFNYRYFRSRLDNEIKRARRYGLDMSLMLVDVDHFGKLNQVHGPGAGQTVLAELGGVLRDALRETEIVARTPNEQFAVILTQTPPDQAVVAAERVRKAVSSRGVQGNTGEALPVSVSIGLVGLPGGPDDPEALLKQAENALRAAKASGRDRVCLATPPTESS